MNYLTIHEVEKTLGLAMEHSARDHLMLLLSFRHGMRRGEVTQLAIGDIKNGRLHIKRLKGSLETTQPLMPDSNEVFDEVAALERWMQFRPTHSDYLFPSPNSKPLSGRWIAKLAKHYLKAAGIHDELTHHHAFKHAFCSIQARTGIKIEYIAQSVGHKDIKNTRVYCNITDSEAMEVAAGALTKALSGR